MLQKTYASKAASKQKWHVEKEKAAVNAENEKLIEANNNVQKSTQQVADDEAELQRLNEAANSAADNVHHLEIAETAAKAEAAKAEVIVADQAHRSEDGGTERQ